MIGRLVLNVMVSLIVLWGLPSLSHAGTATVIQVFDGDTILVVENGKEAKVRLVGVDSPETYKGEDMPGQPFSRKSQKYLSTLVLRKTVEIVSYGTDSYNRILGVVYLDGININFEMIRSGFAEVYKAVPMMGFDISAYREAEEQARKAGRGMWVQGDKYVSPWNWRRMHRK